METSYTTCTVVLKRKLPPLFASRKTQVLSHETQGSIHFGIDYKQLACEKTINFSQRGKVYPARAFAFLGSCVTSHDSFRNRNFLSNQDKE